MSESTARRAEVTHLAGTIERLAAELALAEEPVCFAAALEVRR